MTPLKSPLPRLVLVVAGGVLTLFLAQAALAFMTPPAPPPGPDAMLPALLSNVLTVTMLLLLARRMAPDPVGRGLRLWTIWGGIQAISFAELLLFDIGIGPAATVWLVAYSLVVAAITAAFMGWAAPSRAAAVPAGAVRVRPVWLALAPPLYIACYFIAGMAVWPFVADYYLSQAQPMPAVGQVLTLQVFRGLAFAAIVLLVVHACDGSRRERAVVAGLTLAVLGGVAPLVMPNPLMPTAIRMAHLFEVTPSIFLFGAAMAWALTRRPRVPVANGTLATQP